jgi:hypothetical protein
MDHQLIAATTRAGPSALSICARRGHRRGMDAAPRALVAYSTAAGSTAGIAERIAQVLRDADLAGVDGLVVGSAVHDMAWLAPWVEVLRRAAASGTPAVTSRTH